MTIPLQPTEQMVEEGISALWEQMPGVMDQLYEYMDQDEVNDLLSDTVVFIWQAMASKVSQQEEKE